jgi:arabinofuranosyltransferase
VPQFSSADPASKAPSRWPVVRLAGRPSFPYDKTVRVSLWASVAVVAVLFGWGAWQRRWIADDGLIVLRTVRNLLAGNGPVFNAGERVEANTSVVWTYLVYACSWLTWPMRLEYVALVLALGLSLVGLALLMLGTGRLYAPSLLGRRAIMLPAGALVYVAVPPARDFATSGLESGLVMAYLGLLWWMLVCWSQAGRSRPAGPVFIAALAFVAGCSVLVRPELALIGGLALIMMLIVAQGWRRRLTIVVAGGLLPVGYQIFRMGYYGLLFPGTALAKDAGGDKWSQGLIYLSNFNEPYALWVPVLLLAGLGLVLWASAQRHKSNTGRKGANPTTPARGRLARTVQSPTAVVVFIVVSGLLQALYWIRQGGDFMHGRVLLVPLFCLIAPVAVVPVAFPEGARLSREAGYWLAGAVSALWMAIAGWALYAANSSGLGDDATRVTYSGIVDERRFYAQATGHAHPLTAADYLDYPRMRAVLVALNNTPDGALLLPSGNYDQWDLVPPIPPGSEPPAPPPAPQKGPHSVFFTNLGMVGMNVGLDVRVIDQIGLANPLAAHTARLQHGRIGHDKNLFPDWVIADGPWVKGYPGIPGYLDMKFVQQATAALRCPATQQMLNSVRAPMGLHRFVSNFLHSYEFTKYRIDRVPRYELIRCGLDVPDSGSAPYTGLPATGP